MAPPELQLPGARPTEKGCYCGHQESSAPHALIHRRAPCACYESLLFLGHLVQEDGEEVEETSRLSRAAAARSRCRLTQGRGGLSVDLLVFTLEREIRQVFRFPLR
jgi:hypothetical protein